MLNLQTLINPELKGDILLFLILTVASFIFLKALRFLTAKNIKLLTKKTSLQFDDALAEAILNISSYFYLTFSLWFSSQFISLGQKTDRFIFAIFIISVGIEGAKFINRIAEAIYSEFIEENVEENNRPIINLMLQIIKVCVWVITILLILQTLGYNITTLLAGVGVGGIAIAFALQNILSDIFASFSIFFDKPFEIGDYIVVGQNKGVVKKIGIKTTRIESVEGQEVIIPNKDLTESILHNYGRIKHRRIAFNLGIKYETPNQKIKKAKEIITNAIEKAPNVERVDRVFFKTFGDFALVFEIVYFMNTSDYKTYLETQEKINLEIKEKFEKQGIDFAYPTQTIILEKN